MKIREEITSWSIVNEDTGKVLGSISNIDSLYFYTANLSSSGSSGGCASSKEEAIQRIVDCFSIKEK